MAIFFIQANESPVIYDMLEDRQRDDWDQGRDFLSHETWFGKNVWDYSRLQDSK